MAEQMENVIARASGNESAKFTNNDFLNKEVQRMRSAAEQIPGKPLTKLKNQKLSIAISSTRFSLDSFVIVVTVLSFLSMLFCTSHWLVE